MLTRSSLAIKLSKLKVFLTPNIHSEQYPTDSEIASDILWQAYMQGDIEDKRITDLGAGTGILGIGALLLGAKSCDFVEKDPAAIAILEKNLEGMAGFAIIPKDISSYNVHVDIVLQNPPFGTREKHADREFLQKAFAIAPVVYSFHKTATVPFLRKFAEVNKYTVSHQSDFRFALKKTQSHHTRRIHRIEVSCFRFTRLK